MKDLQLPLPNLFIPGAPKCGTTALYEYLRHHPQIYLPIPKEPAYFARDLWPDKAMSWRRYEKLFKIAEDSVKWRGDASTLYLMSETAIKEIEQVVNAPRYLVCVRHPIDLAVSLHGERLRQGFENVEDFHQAWSLQEARERGEVPLPPGCPHRRHMLYRRNSRLGEQVQRMLQVVSRERILFVFLEDLGSNPRNEYERVLDFLGIDDDGRQDFRVVREARTRRWPLLHAVVRQAAILKGRLGIGYLGETFNSLYERVMTVAKERKPIAPGLLDEMKTDFCDDVALLEHLTGQRPRSTLLRE